MRLRQRQPRLKLNPEEYTLVRNQVLERDGWRCPDCGAAQNLQVHHMKPSSQLGWETGRIAHSLASGHGFGSPFFGWTGPTAWMGPVYPALVAGVFKVFGIYSVASAYVILSLNCLFAALTSFPLHFIARIAFGKKTATAAAWAWALFPYSFDFAAGQVWNTTLSALLFVLAVAVTIALERKVDLRSLVIWGVVCALS